MVANTRKRIGLVFFYSDQWIGGSYYILNLIKALNTLSEDKKPELHIFAETEKEFQTVKEDTNYPFLVFRQVISPLGASPLTFLKEFINKALYKLMGTVLFTSKNEVQVDVCFPNPKGYFFKKLNPKHPVFWIPDFQDIHLPHFFDQSELDARYASHKHIAEREKHVVFSSKDAQKDFQTLFPSSKTNTYVLNFAVSHPEYESLNINDLKEKFDIHQPYYFAPNQFWQHKNQTLLLEAMRLLKDKNLNFQLVFSGKMQDYRNQTYTKRLLEKVDEYQLQDQIRFLGFIDRAEQLKLMKEALAVVQPSLFEGWSTVVEDAKAMNQYIILSNLKVHLEQSPVNGIFFDPENPHELAEVLSQHLLFRKEKVNYQYSTDVLKFAKNFLEIASMIDKSK